MNNKRSLLISLLALTLLATLAACTPEDTGTGSNSNNSSSSPNDQNNQNNQNNNSSNNEEAPLYPPLCFQQKEDSRAERCSASPTSVGLSFLVKEIKIPAERQANDDVFGGAEKLPNTGGELLAKLADTSNIDLQQKINDQITNKHLQLVLEFEGWTDANTLPTEPFRVNAWSFHNDTLDKDSVDKSFNAQSSSSKSFFPKATITQENGKNILTTEKGVLRFPLQRQDRDLKSILFVENAVLKAEITGDATSGYKLGPAYIAGDVRKWSVTSLIYQVEAYCKNNSNDKCMDVCVDGTSNTGKTCARGLNSCTPIHEDCLGSGFCRNLASNICGHEETTINKLNVFTKTSLPGFPKDAAPSVLFIKDSEKATFFSSSSFQ